MSFDFCKYVIDDKVMFAASYRPENATLADRKSVISGGRQCESFTDALGYLELWLRMETNAFGKKKEEEPKPKPEIVPGPGAEEEKPKELEPPAEEPVEDPGTGVPPLQSAEEAAEEEKTDGEE